MSLRKPYARLYSAVVDDSQIAGLSDLAFRVLFLLRARSAQVRRQGMTEVPAKPASLLKELRLATQSIEGLSVALQELLDAGLVLVDQGQCVVTGWDDFVKAGDSSAARAARYRKRKAATSRKPGPISIQSGRVDSTDLSDFDDLDVNAFEDLTGLDGFSDISESDPDFGDDGFALSASSTERYDAAHLKVIGAIRDLFGSEVCAVGYDPVAASRITWAIGQYGLAAVLAYIDYAAAHASNVFPGRDVRSLSVAEVVCADAMTRALQSHTDVSSRRPKLQVVR